jgi:hypothetical protein
VHIAVTVLQQQHRELRLDAKTLRLATLDRDTAVIDFRKPAATGG